VVWWHGGDRTCDVTTPICERNGDVKLAVEQRRASDMRGLRTRKLTPTWLMHVGHSHASYRHRGQTFLTPHPTHMPSHSSNPEWPDGLITSGERRGGSKTAVDASSQSDPSVRTVVLGACEVASGSADPKRRFRSGEIFLSWNDHARSHASGEC